MRLALLRQIDTDITEQANYLNEMRQRADQKAPNDQSVDVETMKLKRRVDKHSQWFDMLRQVIDKYNETAKGIIDESGR